MPLLVRSWNVFHGNAVPPERQGHLEAMVRLATADGPDAVCLQELPVWALAHLEEWSGMQAAGEVAQPPRLGPLPSTAAAGRALTSLHHGLLRSAFSGQANAILVAPRLRIRARERAVLNARSFRAAQARALRLGPLARLGWAKERRICHAVCLADGDRRLVVANLHATSFAAEPRLAEAEILRAAAFADALAAPGETCVLAGDFNAGPAAPVFAELAAWGFSGGGEGIDRILVRGAAAGPLRVWPEERRRPGGRLLSDHAPVEVTIE